MSFREKCDAVPLEIRDVELPAPWSFTAYVREPSALERQKYEAKTFLATTTTDKSGKAKVTGEVDREFFKTRLVALCLCDERGNPEFQDIEEGAAYLNSKGARLTEYLYDEAAKLARLTKEDVEELAGNSESSQSDDSHSDSPLPSAA